MFNSTIYTKQVSQCIVYYKQHGLNVENCLTNQNLNLQLFTCDIYIGTISLLKCQGTFLAMCNKCETILFMIVFKSFFQEFIVSRYVFSVKDCKDIVLRKIVKKG